MKNRSRADKRKMAEASRAGGERRNSRKTLYFKHGLQKEDRRVEEKTKH